eukprot:6843192-Alexandrium_andersonii.AAC.1
MSITPHECEPESHAPVGSDRPKLHLNIDRPCWRRGAWQTKRAKQSHADLPHNACEPCAPSMSDAVVRALQLQSPRLLRHPPAKHACTMRTY